MFAGSSGLECQRQSSSLCFRQRDCLACTQHTAGEFLILQRQIELLLLQLQYRAALVHLASMHKIIHNKPDTGLHHLAIHRLQASKAYSFRRGTTQARINSLAFSAEGVSPRILACASSHGTVHLWNLDQPGSLTSRSSSGLLSAVIPSSMTDYVDPQRCIVNLRLPAGVPRICAIQVHFRGS